jgi:putative DNA primase/helicase
MIDIKALRATIDIVAVIGSRIQLTKRGSEFYAICPFHDENSASFSVVPEKGFYFCFGCGASGDSVDFIRELDGLSFQDACAQLGSADYQALPMKAGYAKRTPRLAWWSTVPPEDNNKPASFALSSLGAPSMVWCYKTADGKPWGYVARYEVEHDGKKSKEIRQWTYGKEGEHSEGDCAWACKHFSRPRPLYGLDLLPAPKDTQTIIVEGEKTCDAARVLFPQAACVTWPGGTNGVEYADWTPLYGRRVVLIPDHDEPGQKACQYIAALLASNHCTVSIVQPESTRPKGWDLADAVADNWVPSVALEWAKANKRTYSPTPLQADTPVTSEAATQGNGEPTKKSKPRGNLRDVDTLPPEPQGDVPPAFSDDALAAQIAHKYGQDWRYVAEWGKWLHWTGISWERDRTSTVFNLVRLQCRAVVNYEQGALLNEGAKRSLTSRRTHAAVEGVLRCDPTVATVSEIWDSDPWLLSTPAGVIDLKTGECRPNRREDFQTRSTLVAPGGTCPRWLAFLDTVTNHDADLQAYLQRLVGYSLTAVTTEQMLAFFFGTGANGKGVFLRTVCAIMGGYATTASMDIFSESQNDLHKNVFARLNKMRLVSAQETEEGKRWAEARIKQFTGGDMIQANFMRQDEFEFKPTFKLLFAGNHKPGLRSVDEAMRRRVHIVPFTVTIPPEQRDPLLDEKLKAEYPGILQWMIAGCVAWQQHGLLPPASVVAATDEYLEIEDALGGWLEENCDLGEAKSCATGDLYRNYVSYCEHIKEHPWSQKRLIQNLQARGITRERLMGLRILRGIDLKIGQATTQEDRW